MQFKKGWVFIFTILVALTFILGQGLCTPLYADDDDRDEGHRHKSHRWHKWDQGPKMECTVAGVEALGLADEEFGLPVTITSAMEVLAAGDLPAYCEVRGTIWPEINFAVKLPAGWNQNFYMVGGGGWNGSINYGAMEPALQMNYATAGTDSGHQTDEPLATFAYDFGGNPNAAQKKKDFAYRSYYETAVVAKKIMKAYYGRRPKYSYWVGCSEGGREALLMAQRYPKVFQGIICGAPVLYLTRAHMWSIWNPNALLGDGEIFPNQIQRLAETIYQKCDSVDTLMDGLIDDPRKCDFNPVTDLNICETASDTCFTLGQIAALKKIYGGVETSYGKLVFPGMPLGAETAWVPWIIGNPSLQQLFGESSMLYYSTTPPFVEREIDGVPWTWPDYDYDLDPQYMEETSKIVDMIDTDLREFKKQGGKLIHYTGLNDTALTPFMSIDYYEGVLKSLGEKPTKEFYKLYLIPGTAHCGGGIGCFDRNNDVTNVMFPALVDWVEEGMAPESLTGTRPSDGRTRPMCPYPEVARFLGVGGLEGIESADNFTCVEPVSAVVRIEGPLSLTSGGSFTASITPPKGYHTGLLQLVAVVCEGAPATKVDRFFSEIKHYDQVYAQKDSKHEKSGSVSYLKAEFNVADLINILPGEDVTFTVTAIFEHKGRQIAFEGSDKVEVISSSPPL